MQNPSKWFRDGIAKLETAIQGHFTDPFRSIVADAVKVCTEEDWDACINLLIKETKKSTDFTVGDFLQALREVRGASSLRASRWEPRAPGKGSPDWGKMAEAIAADPVAPEGSKEIARFLARRKGSKTTEEPVRRGGEKYRTKPT